LLAAGVLVLGVHPASAHGSGSGGWQDVVTTWSADPLVSLPLILSSVLYAQGLLRLRRRLGHLPSGLGTRSVLLFASGILALTVALLSKLEGLAGALLSAHMVQHVLLVAVAPPLLVLGKPEVAWLWSLPGAWRRNLARQPVTRSSLAVLSPFARPIPAALLHMAVLWVWHSPALFDAAAAHDKLHWLEHVLFFGTALLFWRAVIRAAAGREGAASALVACFITLLQSGILSALLGFARAPLYRVHDPALWGLTALQDQHLAGAIMSIPMGMIYLGAGLAMTARLLGPAAPEQLLRSQG
jgi:cytochrome c oxidase assembly factor CtaG